MESARKIFPNEIGPHNPELQRRYVSNPVTNWVGRFVTDHRKHPDAEFQMDIYDEYAFGMQDVVVIVPRSFSKSTTTENFCKYLACEYEKLLKEYEETGNSPVYPYKRVQVVSSTGNKAEEIMEHIKEELEHNELIQAYYGNISKTADKWQERRIKLASGFDLRVGGRGCQIRGFRPDLLIFDDVEDDEEVESDERMEKTRRWTDSAVFGTLDETHCRGFFIGTDLHPEGLLRYIAAKPDVKKIEFWAYKDRIEEPGYELWPSKWSHERLQSKKAKIGTRAFRQEYLNDPMITENPIIMRDWFKVYSPEDEWFKDLSLLSFFTVTCVDPAISKQDKADYTAIVTLSATFEADPRIFVRKVERGHWNMGTTVIKAFNQYQDFNGNVVGIETTAYQEALAHEFNRFCEDNNRTVNIQEFKPDKDKERRTNAEAPTIERGRVYYDITDEQQLGMVDECVYFQPGKTNIKKDRLDAFIYGLNLIRKWGGRKTSSGPHIVRARKKVNPITGI